ncbi:MAG: hypothetical protein RSD41_05395, partial [Kiritimatiellia bacterium]
SATDAVGTTTFAYDVYSQLTTENMVGLYNKTLLRHWDAFGRSVGYSVDETRQATLHYDDAAFTDNKKAGLMTGLVKW